MAYDPTPADTAVWGEMVIQGYLENDLIGSDKTIFKQGDGADQLLMPIFDSNTSSIQVDPALRTVGSASENTLTIPAFTPVTEHRYIGYSEINKTNIPLPPEVATRLAANVANKVGKTVQGVIASGALGNGNAVDLGAGGATPTAAEVKAAINTVATKFDRAGVYKDSRFMVLDPDSYYILAGDETVQNREWGGNGNVANPYYLDFNHFKIMNSALISNTNLAGDTSIPSQARVDFASGVGVAWQRDAVGMGQWGNAPTTNISNEPTFAAVFVEVRNHMGCAVGQPSGVFAITNNG